VIPGVTVREKDLIQPVELKGAAQVTGQFGRFRYGAMGAFEDDVEFEGDAAGTPVRFTRPGSDYGVMRLMYEDAPGGAYRAFGMLSTGVFRETGDAIAHSLDGHYLSEDGKWKVDAQAFTSDIDGSETGFGAFVDLEYTFRKGVRQRVGIDYRDRHVDINDLGFLERNDLRRIRAAHTRTSSNLSWARDNQFDLRGSVQQNLDGLFTGGGIFLSDRATFDDLTRVTARLNFRPGAYDDLNSFGNGIYRVDPRFDGFLKWESDSTKALSVSFEGGLFEEAKGGLSWSLGAGLQWRPSDRFNLNLRTSYDDFEGWLLHQEALNFTTFDGEQWSPTMSVDYFISARQQFRVSLQWVGIRAGESEFFQIPATPGELVPVAKPPGPSDSFSVSQVSLQARYRWEIAPLSDVFVVYTRLSNQGAALAGRGFGDVFDDAYHEPLTNLFVVKLRYRFGS